VRFIKILRVIARERVYHNIEGDGKRELFIMILRVIARESCLS